MTKYQVETRQLKPVVVSDSDVMTLSDAAKRLKISLNSLVGLIQRGRLQKLVDTSEPNPTKATRVLVADVDKELSRRRARRREGDSRLAA